MSSRTIFASIATVVFFNSCNPDACAQIVAVDSTYNPGGTYYSIPTDSTYGWRFTVGTAPISVTQLGFFDTGLDGLSESHQIGIWDTSGNLMIQGTVQSGTASTLAGAYRFELVSATTLSANTTYLIGAHSPNPVDTAIMFDAPQTYASEITYLGANYAPVSGFAPPTTAYGAAHGVFGPNFQFTAVPEPEHYAMMMGVGLIAFACIRKRLAVRS
jgi:hypothetical protein